MVEVDAVLVHVDAPPEARVVVPDGNDAQRPSALEVHAPQIERDAAALRRRALLDLDLALGLARLSTVVGAVCLCETLEPSTHPINIIAVERRVHVHNSLPSSSSSRA